MVMASPTSNVQDNNRENHKHNDRLGYLCAMTRGLAGHLNKSRQINIRKIRGLSYKVHEWKPGVRHVDWTPPSFVLYESVKWKHNSARKLHRSHFTKPIIENTILRWISRLNDEKRKNVKCSSKLSTDWAYIRWITGSRVYTQFIFPRYYRIKLELSIGFPELPFLSGRNVPRPSRDLIDTWWCDGVTCAWTGPRSKCKFQ